MHTEGTSLGLILEERKRRKQGNEEKKSELKSVIRELSDFIESSGLSKLSLLYTPTSNSL